MQLMALEMNDPVYGDGSRRQLPKSAKENEFSVSSEKRSLVTQTIVTSQGSASGANH